MVLRQSLDLPPQNSVMNLAGVSWCGHFYDARWFVVMVVVLVGVLLVGWLVFSPEKVLCSLKHPLANLWPQQ